MNAERSWYPRYLAGDLRKDVMTGYDAAGHLVWRQRFGASG